MGGLLPLLYGMLLGRLVSGPVGAQVRRLISPAMRLLVGPMVEEPPALAVAVLPGGLIRLLLGL